MSMDVRDFMVTHKKYFPSDFCSQTINQLKWKQDEFVKHSFYSIENKDAHSYDDDFKVLFASVPNTQAIIDAIRDLSVDYASRYDYIGLQGFTHPRFNQYDVGTNMKEHCDHIHDIFDGVKKGIPIFSMLISLNNDYEGGELVFFKDSPYKLEEGDVLIFPSNFIYPHKVTPITSGVRYSVVSWVY